MSITHFMGNLVVFLPTASSHNGPGCFCLCFIGYISEFHYLLSECSRLTLDKSPDLSAPSASPPSLPMLLHHNFPAQRAEQEVAPLRGNSSSLISLPLPHPPSLAWDSVTFMEGGFISSGAPALFGGGTLKGVESRQWGCCKGGTWKRVKSWKMRLENCDTTAAEGKHKNGEQHEKQEEWSNSGYNKNKVDFPLIILCYLLVYLHRLIQHSI